jgi:hypothetical protein
MRHYLENTQQTHIQQKEKKKKERKEKENTQCKKKKNGWAAYQNGRAPAQEALGLA